MIYISITAVIFTGIMAVVAYLIYKKKIYYWLAYDIIRLIRYAFTDNSHRPIHVMFAFVDHFEPGNGGVPLERQIERVSSWVELYPKLASRHRDSDGRFPQHTFFYPPHYDTHNHLERLTQLCSLGFGEIEMHLHHDRIDPWPDDEFTFRQKLEECKVNFSRYGIFCLPDGKMTYGFIHGDWALANSLTDGAHCGINDELRILKESGCYADFTFPVSNESQPALANTLFYAMSSPDCPKGYNRYAVPIKCGQAQNPNALLIVQGIIGLRWKSRTHRFKPSIEQSNIDVSDFPFRERIDYWIKKGIHVSGRPDWVFVKIHTHGARDEDRKVLLGEACDDMFSYLETQYNDGDKYKLHYVSAREMYNIIRAAEDGYGGNPNIFRDYAVPRYTYLPRI